jgi:hypothetical protein
MSGQEQESGRQDHPSFGLMTVCPAGSGSMGCLFGTDDHVGKYVSVEIHRAYVKREGTAKHVWPDALIVSVVMSRLQWARLVALGSSPCTLDIVGGEEMPPPPDERGAHRLVSAFRQELGRLASVMEAAEASAISLTMRAKPATKAEMRGLLDQVSTVRATLENGLGHLRDLFDVDLESAVAEAQAQVVDFADQIRSGKDVPIPSIREVRDGSDS